MCFVWSHRDEGKTFTTAWLLLSRAEAAKAKSRFPIRVSARGARSLVERGGNVWGALGRGARTGKGGACGSAVPRDSGVGGLDQPHARRTPLESAPVRAVGRKTTVDDGRFH